MGSSREPGKAYLSVCAIYRDEARYLREWIAFHRLVGVDRFYLYNNRSKDDHLEALAPYLEDGTVVMRDWRLYPGQIAAYEHCIAEHREDSRWIAFIDADEFLFSPTGKPLPEVLADFEAWPGVGVHRTAFGTSGHKTPQAGLVIENYVRRARSANTTGVIKSIVDPARVESCRTCHAFVYQDGAFAVDETKEAIGPPISQTEKMSHSLLVVNHYWTKSEEEGVAKLSKPTAYGKPRFEKARQLALGGTLNEVVDEEILRYVPALREELARVDRTGAGEEGVAASAGSG
jgi:glycosyl transferase family 92